MTVTAGVSFAVAKPSALELTAQAGEGAKAFNLKGKHARQQLVATAKDTGKDVDVTRTAKYAVAPANVVAVTPAGLVTPLGDGEATITATIDGVQSEVKVTVTEYGVVQPIILAMRSCRSLPRPVVTAAVATAKAAARMGSASRCSALSRTKITSTS